MSNWIDDEGNYWIFVITMIVLAVVITAMTITLIVNYDTL